MQSNSSKFNEIRNSLSELELDKAREFLQKYFREFQGRYVWWYDLDVILYYYAKNQDVAHFIITLEKILESGVSINQVVNRYVSCYSPLTHVIGHVNDERIIEIMLEAGATVYPFHIEQSQNRFLGCSQKIKDLVQETFDRQQRDNQIRAEQKQIALERQLFGEEPIQRNLSIANTTTCVRNDNSVEIKLAKYYLYYYQLLATIGRKAYNEGKLAELLKGTTNHTPLRLTPEMAALILHYKDRKSIDKGKGNKPFFILQRGRDGGFQEGFRKMARTLLRDESNRPAFYFMTISDDHYEANVLEFRRDTNTFVLASVNSELNLSTFSRHMLDDVFAENTNYRLIRISVDGSCSDIKRLQYEGHSCAVFNMLFLKKINQILSLVNDHDSEHYFLDQRIDNKCIAAPVGNYSSYIPFNKLIIVNGAQISKEILGKPTWSNVIDIFISPVVMGPSFMKTCQRVESLKDYIDAAQELGLFTPQEIGKVRRVQELYVVANEGGNTNVCVHKKTVGYLHGVLNMLERLTAMQIQEIKESRIVRPEPVSNFVDYKNFSSKIENAVVHR